MRRLESLELHSTKIQASPLYSQLSSVFRGLICQEKWPVGTVLPSEGELARRYGVSVGTARKALESLEEGGWITRKQGRGTFVTDPVERQFDRFCRIYLTNTNTSVFADCSVTVLRQEKALATPEEAESLGLSHTALVIRLDRRFDRKGVPVILEKQILRADLIQDFEALEVVPINLYRVLLGDFGVAVHRSTERIIATLAHGEVMDVLGVDPGTPVLNTRRGDEDAQGCTIAVVERWFETKSVEYVATLS